MIGTQSAFGSAFEAFLSADEAVAVTAAFADLIAHLAPSTETYSYERLRNFAQPQLSYKRKALFALLDAKLAASENLRINSSEQKRIVISGAGPVGLRAAAEAAVLGFKVLVLELRAEFSRHNVIKTWNHTITDLVSLGLSHYAPQFNGAGTSSGTFHLGIKDIQTCLLKACLLLGVEVRYERGVCGLVDPAASGQEQWAVWSLAAPEARLRLRMRAQLDGLVEAGANGEVAPELALKPGEQDIARLQKRNRVDYFEPAVSEEGAVLRDLNLVDAISDQGLTLVDKQLNADKEMVRAAVNGKEECVVQLDAFDYLLVAEGESSRLIRHLGFARKIWRYANMIGIVVNLDITPNAPKMSPERSLPEFVVTRLAANWRQGPLGKLNDLGYELENMEYLRSQKTHFFVCTIKKPTLVSSGIVREEKDTIKSLLEYDNLNMDKLREFGRELGNLAGVPTSCPLSAKHGVQIFDFSCKGLCTDTLRPFTSPSVKEVVVLPVGDALMNPYWPQGLGVNRGLHTALDAVWAARVHTLQGHDVALHERVTALRAMDWYPLEEGCLVPPVPQKGGVRAATGERAGHDWTVDPVSRYSAGLFKAMHRSDIEVQAPVPTLPVRVRRSIGLRWGIAKEGEEFPDDDMDAVMAKISRDTEVAARKMQI
ncbi:hypothetical protein BC830DRAFT_1220490 [Chytriomyces sp. MP71]|nr:hypothetical protein BC830DRAFT_1220490 [Chytriomyces sp. MP71]